MMKNNDGNVTVCMREAFDSIHKVMKKGGLIYSVSLNKKENLEPVFLNYLKENKMFELLTEERKVFRLPNRKELHNIYFYVLKRL